MKIGKKLTSVIVCIALVMSLCTIPAFAANEIVDESGEDAPNEAATCPECGGTTSHLDNCPQAEATSICSQLLSAESVEEMYALTLEIMRSDPDSLNALTAAEIFTLRDRINELDPYGVDDNTEPMLATLSILPNGGETLEGEPEILAPTGTVFTSTGGSISGGEYYLNADKTLTSGLTISGTVVLDLNGYVLSGAVSQLINVSSGSLTIKDSNPTRQHIGTIDSNGRWRPSATGDVSILGGIICNTGAVGSAGGIAVSAKCVVEGGTIAGCSKNFGPAITASSSGTIVMTGGKVLYNKSTNTANAGGAIYGEVVNNNNGSRISLSNVEISHNVSSSNGGGVCGYIVTVDNCLISDNTAASGGGIYLMHSTSIAEGDVNLKITNSEIKNNEASINGGGVFGVTGTSISVLEGTSITENSAGTSGGGIFGSQIAMTGKDSSKVVVSGNVAPKYGGGVYAATKCELSNCLVNGNRAGVYGGGIYTAPSCPLTIENSSITYNDAIDFNLEEADITKLAGRGGGLFVEGASFLNNVNIDHNRSLRYGGGVQINGKTASLVFSSGSISHNESIGSGAGGVHVTESCYFEFSDGAMEGNIAHEVGGAIHSSYEATIKISNGVIRDNKVYGGRGGAVHVDVGVSLQIEGSTLIEKNHAYTGYRPSAAEIASTEPGAAVAVIYEGAFTEGYGGGITVDSGTLAMSKGSITKNHADAGGGGVALVMIIMDRESPNRNKVVDFDMTGGTISENTTNGNGGGLYLMKNKLSSLEIAEGKEISDDLLDGVPQLDISGGTIKENVADLDGDGIGDGGGAYQEAGTKFVISGTGEISGNKANNGAGVFIAKEEGVAKGEAQIDGGNFNKNIASDNGGALCVNGQVTMTGGSITENEATNGGGIYVDGGNVVVATGTVSSNKAHERTSGQAEAGNEGYGGAVFVMGGNLTIGIEGCKRGAPVVEHVDETHPVIQSNVASFGGGLAVNGGRTDIYCCKMTDNSSDNKGTGMNIFMGTSPNGDEGSVNYHFQGATIGSEEFGEDHGIVSVGGNLSIEGVDIVSVNVVYHYNFETNNASISDWTCSTPKGYCLDLPYCPSEWRAIQSAQENPLVFVGWAESKNPGSIRKKGDYQDVGTPVVIGEEKHYYAIWAPRDNVISYAYSLNGETIMTEAAGGDMFDGAPVKYLYGLSSVNVTIPTPSYPGYRFAGWKFYATSKEKISNWNADPKEAVGGLSLFAGGTIVPDVTVPRIHEAPMTAGADGYLLKTEQNFGDITLVAVFEPASGSLTITRSNTDRQDIRQQSYIFSLNADLDGDDNFDDLSMTVVINGDGSKTLSDLPVGTYQVEELSSWSWRYPAPNSNDGGGKVIEVEIEDPETIEEVSFNDSRSDHQWLSGDHYGSFTYTTSG